MPPPLATYVFGSGSPLVLVHGFLGSAATWNSILPALTTEFTCLAVDLPGHGKSPAARSENAYRVEALADSVVEAAFRVGIKRFSLLGYSMGGRIAMHLVRRSPELIDHLIVESGNPGIDDRNERRQRRDSDDQLAHLIELEGIEKFIERWEALPLFVSQSRLAPNLQAEIREIRRATNPGAAAAFLRSLSPGRIPSLWPRLAEVQVPTLAIAGSEDERYVSVAERIVELIPDAALILIPRAGHAAHLENPEAFAAAVLAFLRS